MLEGTDSGTCVLGLYRSLTMSMSDSLERDGRFVNAKWNEITLF